MRIRSASVLIAMSLLLAGCKGDQAAEQSVLQSAPAAGSSRLSELLGDQDSSGYAMAIEPRRFEFPADHGPHPEFRNEWWYLTGNLDAADGERFGYELTFFRFLLAPRGKEISGSSPGESVWRTGQVYIGHFALTDVKARKFHVAQRYSRDSLDLAGATAEPLRVWLEDWSIDGSGNGSSLQLAAADKDVKLSLTLEPQRTVQLQGDEGLSRKSADPRNASYYYSIPRLSTRGTVQVGERTYRVSGLSWLDREWGSSALASTQRGWDWFALQLSDGSDLMFYRLRGRDGQVDRHSAGTWMPAGQAPVKLQADDVELEAMRFWDSPMGGRYPVEWHMKIDSLGLELSITPVLDSQELEATVRYWEGAVDVSGSLAGRVTNGRGYVELTGYADSDD